MTATTEGEFIAPGQVTQPAALPPALAVIKLPTEVDVTNDDQILDALLSALDEDAMVLVADGSETTFFSCSGVAVLLLGHQRAASASAQLRVAASSAMRRLLQLTQADQVLDIYSSLAAALAGRPESALLPPPSRRCDRR
jgi:anti-anti-sigma factor